MKLSSIISLSDSISKQYDISDPVRLCRQAGVILLYFPMGCSRKACKGFVIRQEQNTAITVSSDISPDMQRIVIYHELAHFFLHISTGIADALQDCAVGCPVSDMEYEADLLSAELALRDAAVLEALSSGADFFEAAAMLHCPPEILDFKLRIMRERGYSLPDAPIESCGGCLGIAADPGFSFYTALQKHYA